METEKETIKDAEYWATVEALKLALLDFDNRKLWPTHEEVFAELRAKINSEQFSNE